MQTALFWGTVTLCCITVGAVLAALWEIRQTVVDSRTAAARFRKYAELHAELVELMDRVEGAEKSLKRLHSRAGMREVREARGGNKLPDWRDDPEGFRKAAEAQLPAARYGKGGAL